MYVPGTFLSIFESILLGSAMLKVNMVRDIRKPLQKLYHSKCFARVDLNILHTFTVLQKVLNGGYYRTFNITLLYVKTFIDRDSGIKASLYEKHKSSSKNIECTVVSKTRTHSKFSKLLLCLKKGESNKMS